MDTWCLIESDPGVFWDLTKRLGVEGVQYEEVLNLEPEAFTQLEADFGRILGLVFLFRWSAGLKTLDIGTPVEYVPPGMFYAKQLVQNSCATQAMLSILLNNESNISLGPALTDFKEFTSQFDPEVCGLTLANHELIREAHNSFRVTHSLQFSKDRDRANDSGREDPFHYVALLPRDDHVWLLDGLGKAPICLGAVSKTTETEVLPWWQHALVAIHKYIERLQELPRDSNDSCGNEIRFNLIAVVPDRLKYLSSTEFPDQSIIKELKEIEETKRRRWDKENCIRRHDFVPFLLCCLRHAAKQRRLVDQYYKVRTTLTQKRE